MRIDSGILPRHFSYRTTAAALIVARHAVLLVAHRDLVFQSRAAGQTHTRIRIIDFGALLRETRGVGVAVPKVSAFFEYAGHDKSHRKTVGGGGSRAAQRRVASAVTPLANPFRVLVAVDRAVDHTVAVLSHMQTQVALRGGAEGKAEDTGKKKNIPLIL